MMQVVVHTAITLLYIVIFLYLIGRWRFLRMPSIPVNWIRALFLIKILAGLALWAIYTWHYTYRDTSDAFRYFDDALVVSRCLIENPGHFFRFMFGINLEDPVFQVYFDQMHGWTSSYNYGIFSDNPTVIRLNAVITLFSFGYYHVHTVFMSFISLLGIVALYRATVQVAKLNERVLFILFAFIPSLLFWSSGVLKEAPLICLLGLFIWSLFTVIFGEFSPKKLTLTLFLFASLFFIKGYVVLSLLPAILFLLVFKVLRKRKIWLAFVLSHTLAFILALNAGFFFKGGDLIYVLGKKQIDFYNVAEIQEAGSTIEIPVIEDLKSFLLNIPGSLYRTYLRPDFRDLDSSLHLMAFGENVVMLLGLGLMIVFIRKVKGKELAVVLFSLSFLVVLGIIIGSVVPVVGAIVRYKVPALPFIAIVLATMVNYSRAGKYLLGWMKSEEI